MVQVEPTAAALVPLWKPPGHEDQALLQLDQPTYAIPIPQPTSFQSSPKLATMTDSKGGLTIVEEVTKIVYAGSNSSTLSGAPLPSSSSSSTEGSTGQSAIVPSSSLNYSTVTSTRYYTSYIPSASPLPSASTYTATQTSPVYSSAPQPTATSSYTSNNIHTGGIVHPNHDQLKTVWVAAVMLFALLIGWNMIILRDILYPWKMWANSIHEAGHIIIGALTGARVYSVTIDPDKGPISGMTGGIPILILTAGYVCSILIGSGLIMAAFDITASKIAALIVYPMLAISFWFGRTWARIRILCCIGISIGFFFINHANALRFYVLFLGILNAFYVVWDALDDFVFRKQNESDVALFSRMNRATTSTWILVWLLFTFVMVALAILGGLHFFNRSMEAQREAQAHFMPT